MDEPLNSIDISLRSLHDKPTQMLNFNLHCLQVGLFKSSRSLNYTLLPFQNLAIFSISNRSVYHKTSAGFRHLHRASHPLHLPYNHLHIRGILRKASEEAFSI